MSLGDYNGAIQHCLYTYAFRYVVAADDGVALCASPVADHHRVHSYVIATEREREKVNYTSLNGMWTSRSSLEPRYAR